MSIKIQALVPEELAESLVLVANAFHRSQSYIIWQAVQRYVNDMLEDIDALEDARIALKRTKESTGKYLTLEEVEIRAAEMRNVQC